MTARKQPAQNPPGAASQAKAMLERDGLPEPVRCTVIVDKDGKPCSGDADFITVEVYDAEDPNAAPHRIVEMVEASALVRAEESLSFAGEQLQTAAEERDRALGQVAALREALEQAVDADALAEWFTDTERDGLDVGSLLTDTAAAARAHDRATFRAGCAWTLYVDGSATAKQISDAEIDAALDGERGA